MKTYTTLKNEQLSNIECHEYVGSTLVYKCATVCAQLSNCLLQRQRNKGLLHGIFKDLSHWKPEIIEDERLGEMNHLKEQDSER